MQQLTQEISELRERVFYSDKNSACSPRRSAEMQADGSNDEISLLDNNDYRSLYDYDVVDEKSNESHQFKFDLQVKLKEPPVPKAPENYLKSLNDIQRFNKNEWCEVRYSEVQKLYNHSPGFTELEINEEIKPYDSLRHLALADKAYGALTFCALKQREVLQTSMTDLLSWARVKGSVTPDQLHNKISELFSDGEYYKVSSDMIQLICGHRAEIVQMRRDGIINYVRDPLLKSALRKIPPSNQMVFSPELLASTLEKNGGVKKTFLPPNKTSSGFKPTSQVGFKKTTRYPSQGSASYRAPSQGARQACCTMPCFQPSQGCGHNHTSQRPGHCHPTQGTGNNYKGTRGPSHNYQGPFRSRGAHQQPNKQETSRNNRKRTSATEYPPGGKRSRF